MKTTQFWVRRYFWVSGMMFLILMAAAWLRGRTPGTAFSESLIWALLSATIFTGARYYKASKGAVCALRKDTEEDVS
jgi:uncharacterized membrane protein